jgi:HSP90 family molecular chaperone
MKKQELIESIREINKSATPEFLAKFSEDELSAYLEHLAGARLEEVAACE